MPNKQRRNKATSSRFRSPGPGGTDSVKDLLRRTVPTLAPISDQVARQRSWQAWLEQRLPAALLAHVTGIVEREDALVIFADSAGWSVRLRYAVAEVEEELRRSHPAIVRVTVRVMPRPGA